MPLKIPEESVHSSWASWRQTVMHVMQSTAEAVGEVIGRENLMKVTSTAADICSSWKRTWRSELEPVQIGMA